MVWRLNPQQGAMQPHENGNYVCFSEYEKLHKTLSGLVADVIQDYKKVEAGEMSASEAMAAIAVKARLVDL